MQKGWIQKTIEVGDFTTAGNAANIYQVAEITDVVRHRKIKLKRVLMHNFSAQTRNFTMNVTYYGGPGRDFVLDPEYIKGCVESQIERSHEFLMTL